MKKKIYILLFLFTCASCLEDRSGPEIIKDTQFPTTFDGSKWKTKEGRDYPYRNHMLEDLMNNQELRVMEKEEIWEFLGEPDRMDNNHLFYQIEQKRIGYWILHTKTMVIQLSEEGKVNWVKVHQ